MNGVNGNAPPPPPPPLALGAVPAVRLKSEISERRPEPPACVQNAMMTKDKKPFTYTPGGLDLSEIRSPRMAKRITRNAAAEGVGAIPQSPLAERGPLPPSALAAMQPQTPIQVFPGKAPPPPPPPPGAGPGPVPPPLPSAKAPSPPSSSYSPYQRPDIKIPENPMGLLRKTGGPNRPSGPLIGPDEGLSKQPVLLTYDEQQIREPPREQPMRDLPQLSRPLVQQSQPMVVQTPEPQSPSVFKSVQPPQQIYKPTLPGVQPFAQPPVQSMQPKSPELKSESRAQVGTLYIPPLNPEELQCQKSSSSEKVDSPGTPGSPLDTLKKAPTPAWLAGRGQQKTQDVPAWARSPPESAVSSAPSTPVTPQTAQSPMVGSRVIPIRIEKSTDVRDNASFNQQQIQYQEQQEQYLQQQQQYLQQQQQYQQQQQQQQYQQQQQQQYQQQQQQYQQQQQHQLQQQQQQQYRQQIQQQQQQQYNQQQQQQYNQQQQQQQQQHIVRVIPIQIEGRSNAGPLSPSSNLGTPELNGAPVQSPTFRILQRVTSRDEEIHSQPAIHHPATVGQSFPVDQLRRVQLNNEDRNLMNRLKNQVNEDTFLHDETDPRYRGPAIPSRAFRMLQTMTDAAEASGDPTCVPRAVIINRGPPPPGMKKTQAMVPEMQDQSSLPASEQRAPEPKKYTGSAIPSRSFQMLQAMVAPENCGPGQSDL